MKGKPWPPEDEKNLRELVKSKTSIEAIAKILGRTKDAIYGKIDSLELKEEKTPKNAVFSSSSFSLPKELISIEEALKTLMGAVEMLKKPGLEQSEVLRLRSIIQGMKIYKEIFADYADYRGLEERLIELEGKYAAHQKKPKNPSAS